MIHRLFFALAAQIVLVASTMPATAASWRFAGGEAGLWADGGFNGLAVGCASPAVSLSFFGFTTRLQPGMSYSVVVSIDGTARRFRARSVARKGAPGSALATSVSGQEAASFLEALRRGRKAEVSTPAGRYDLPLAGSSKALETLGKTCPAAS